MAINILTGKNVDIRRLDKKKDIMYKYTFYKNNQPIMVYRWNERLTDNQAIKEFIGRQNISSNKGYTVKVSRPIKSK
jgi:hypothetical protein